jgi:hypothetical protein
VALVICVAIGFSMPNSPTRQGFHDRLAVRNGPRVICGGWIKRDWAW